jgi:hypothetical protein
MKIYISPCSSALAYREKYLRDVIELAKYPIDNLIENPENADLILVPDPAFAYAHQWELLNRYLDKCYAIGSNIIGSLVIPGLYNNAPTSMLQKKRFIGCSYIYSRDTHRNSFLEFHNNEEKKQYLFSFVGSSASLVRKRLLKINFNRDDVLIKCTNEYNHWVAHQHNREIMQKSYVCTIKQSKFVLCPRGAGWGIIRVFEAMELGVAPIIISDKWLPPMGPNWKSFAIFVKQSDLNNLVEIVERHSCEYEERGHLARKAWEEYFSDTVVFTRCIEAIEELKENRIAVLDRFIFYSYPLILAIDKLKNNFRRWMKLIILRLLNLFKLEFPYELVNK